MGTACRESGPSRTAPETGKPRHENGRPGSLPGGLHFTGSFLDYSRTRMFFFSQTAFSSFGHTVTLTSPRCALRSRSIAVRD
jgi:hypothetical protein